MITPANHGAELLMMPRFIQADGHREPKIELRICITNLRETLISPEEGCALKIPLPLPKLPETLFPFSIFKSLPANLKLPDRVAISNQPE
jgi:hypothetical protein